MKIYDIRLNENNEIIYTTNINGSIKLINAISVTKAQLLTLITNSSLLINNLYSITDSFHGGNIVVSTLSNNTIDNNAIWVRPTTLCAFGIIGLTSGASGSVNTLTVNGVNIMTAAVNYATSLTNTATLVANNINANSATSGYRAVSIANGYIVIASTTAGTTKNGYVISGTATTITLGNSNPLANGVNSTSQILNVIYDYSTDRINQCSDSYENILICEKGYAGDPFQEFPWSDTRFYNNRINSINFKNNFFYDPGSKFMGNICLTNSSFNTNFISQGSGATFGVFYNTLMTDSAITNNVFNYTTTGYIGQIYRNTLSNSARISSNCITGSTNTFVSIVNNVLSGANSSIGSNIAVVSNVPFIIQNNLLLGAGSSILGNTGANGLKILANNLMGSGSSIKNNIFTSGINTNTTISYNILNGFSSFIQGITLSNINVTLISNNLNGRSSSIQNCTLSGSGNILKNITINGDTSILDSVNFNSITNALVTDITLEDSNITFGSITLTSDFPTLSKIKWTADTYSTTAITPTLNGGTNLGLASSPITLSYVPAKFFSTEAYIEASGLVGTSATLRIGIDTDADNCILPDTVATTLNSTITNGTIVKTKSTAVRKITATPLVANITAGTFKLILKGSIGL